jgi:GNAT superfamily N-acetyltransferase
VLDFSFRSLDREHLDQVVDLVVRCDSLVARWAPLGWELPPDWPQAERQTWEEDLADEDVWTEIACDPAGDVLGVVAASAREGADGTGQLIALFVEPDLHGRGLGSRLIERSEEWMRGQGWNRATVSVLEGAPAVGFYASHGWRPDGRRDLYVPFDLPTIGFDKELPR